MANGSKTVLNSYIKSSEETTRGLVFDMTNHNRFAMRFILSDETGKSLEWLLPNAACQTRRNSGRHGPSNEKRDVFKPEHGGKKHKQKLHRLL